MKKTFFLTIALSLAVSSMVLAAPGGGPGRGPRYGGGPGYGAPPPRYDQQVRASYGNPQPRYNPAPRPGVNPRYGGPGGTALPNPRFHDVGGVRPSGPRYNGPGGIGGRRPAPSEAPRFSQPRPSNNRGPEYRRPPAPGYNRGPESNRGGGLQAPGFARHTYSGNGDIYSATVAGIYNHLHQAYDCAYQASYVLAQGFHKDEEVNQLVAAGTALTDIADQTNRAKFETAMRNCLPTQDEMATMYLEHREELEGIMKQAKSYQKATNKHFGWFGFNLVLAALTCPPNRRNDLNFVINDAQRSISQTKAMFKGFDSEYKSLQQLVGKDDQKEIRKKTQELKEREESSYGL